MQRAAQHHSTQVQAESDPASLSGRSASPEAEGQLAAAEDPSRYCPVCSHRLESRRCKLVCSVCGYYLSCADYY